MDLEDLIKKYPDGINHKTTHAECVKLESLLSNSNLSKQKSRLPKLASFLVSSLLHSEEQTMTIAVNNIRTCVPYIQEQLQTLILQELAKIQVNMKESLEKSGNPARALLVWRTVVHVLGSTLHKNRTSVNTLLVIPEKAFKSPNPAVQKNAFLSWKELIDNFALNPEIISHAKRVKLILQPLMSNKSKNEDVHLARASTWWHIAFKLQDKLSVEFEKVCVPLLRFVFQLPSESGKISNSGSEESQCSRALLLKGSEILLRILELPGQNFPAGLTSPKKMPNITAAALIVPVSHHTIAKNIGLILEVTKKSLLFLNSLQPACPLAPVLIQILLLRINQLSKEKVQIEVDAVAECIQFIHICVKENLVQSGLKLVDNVTRLLSSKVLTSHCYHRATNSTEVMNGVPALGFLEMLLKDMVFATGNSQRFVSVFNRLVTAGVDETDFYLSFAHTVMSKLTNLCYQEGNLSPENIDIIINLWMQTSNVLWRRIQKTQEVNQGDSLEHNFACLLATLTLPLKIQMISQKFLQNREVDKSWSNLCKAFMRSAALVVNTEANVACEELCNQLLQMISPGMELPPNVLVQPPNVLAWLSSSLGVLLGCIDFQSVNTMQTVTSLLQSPEGWRKRQQQPLGNLTSCVKLLGYTLTSTYVVLSKGTSVQGIVDGCVSSCLQHCKTLFTSVTLSSTLVSLVTLLGPSIVPFYSQTTEAKKMSSHIRQLDKTWQTIVTAFLLHYKGLHSQDTFDVLHPLLEPTLLHPNKSIQENARNLWVSAFADTYNTLNFPDSFKAVLKEVRPALIPGSQISSVDTITSFDQSLEEEDLLKSATTHKKSVAVAEPEEPVISKKETFVTPRSTRKGSRKDRTLSDDEEFVVIPPRNQSSKRILTEHQKEVLKNKSPIPAMYSDLTQETQISLDTLTEDSVIVDNFSKPEASSLVEIPNCKAEPPDAEEEIPVVDIASSGSSTLINSLPNILDLENTPTELAAEKVDDSPQSDITSRSPQHHSDDSQLSGTDSPIVLPSGVSSKEIRMPRIVKRDAKLKSAKAEIVLIRVTPSPQKQASSELECETASTKRSKRKSSKKRNSEKAPPVVADHKDKENVVSKPIEPDISVAGRKELQSENVSDTSPVTRRRTKDILVETPRRVNSEKKQKSGKRKGQNAEQENVKKKSKSEQDVNNQNSVETDVELSSVSDNLARNISSQDLLTEMEAESNSSNLEVLYTVEGAGRNVETVCIEDSVSEPVVDMDSNNDLSHVGEVNQVDGELEAQEMVPSLPGDGCIEISDAELERQSEGVDDSEIEHYVAADNEDEAMVEAEQENVNEVVEEEEAVDDEQNVEEQDVEEDAPTDVNDEVCVPENEIEQNDNNKMEEEAEEEEETSVNTSNCNNPDEPSQNIVEYLTEELPVAQTAIVTRKRKASSPIRSSSNRTIMTVGVGSRWKVKNSPNKKLESEDKSRKMSKVEDEEDNIEVSPKFTKDEKENTSIISNEAKVVLEPLIITPGKMKQSLMSLRKKSLRTPPSPMSRSQRMLEAAMKTRSATADVSPSSPKYVYSPHASPSSSILKVKSLGSEKPSSPQSGQKRRVSFADPPVTEDNQTVNSVSNLGHYRNLQDKSDTVRELHEEMEEDSVKSVLTEQDVPEAEVIDIDSQSPVYPDLLGCTDSIRAVITQITSSMWSRGLDKLLRSKNIITVGDLSALTYPEIMGLPIVAPKVKTLRSVLAKYHQHQTKLQTTNSKQLIPLLTDSNSEEPEEVEMKQDGDIEQYQAEEEEEEGEEKDENTVMDIVNKDEEPVMGTQDLWMTQAPSSELPTSQEEEEEEEVEEEVEEQVEENASSSPPLQSLEDALNDNNLLQTSMLETNTDFSSFLENEKPVLEEHPTQDQQLMTSVIDKEATPSNNECEVPIDEDYKDAGEDPENFISVIEKSFTLKVKDFIKEMSPKELLDTMVIVQNALTTKVL